MMPLSYFSLGTSGDGRFGGLGAGGQILKDGIPTDQALTADNSWNILVMRQTGKILQSQGEQNFSYDGQTVTALRHIWVNVYVDVLLADQTTSKKFLAFSFLTTRFGQEYKCQVGFVEGCAVSVFADEMYPGDALSLVVQSDIATNTVDGDFCFVSSQLPS